MEESNIQFQAQDDNAKLKALQQVETQLLIQAVRIFDAHEITYYLIGGTLLGAVRHGGFIPWDDDIDIAVPRNDYEKLITVMHQLEDPVVGMEYYRDDPSLYFYPVKLVHKGYHITDPRKPGVKSHPWIDVLPIDGLPDRSLPRRWFHLKMLYYRLLLGMHYVDRLRNVKRSAKEQAVIRFAKASKIGKLINPTKIKDKIDRTLKKHRPEDCSRVGTCMGAYFFHEFVPKEHFGKGSEVFFEGKAYRAPELIHPYLTHMYGDYMQLPPEDARVVHIEGEIEKVT